MRRREFFGVVISVVVSVALVYTARMTTPLNAQTSPATKLLPPDEPGNQPSASGSSLDARQRGPKGIRRAGEQMDADPVKDKLEAVAKTERDSLHPLAAAQPDKSVIVCIAGCGRDTIVYAEPPRPTADPVAPAVKQAVLTTPATGATDSPGEVVCLAGCYSGPKSYPALPSHAPRKRDAATASGGVAPAVIGRSTWVTTVSHAGEARAAGPAATPAAKGKRAPARNSSEWFTRRFKQQP